MKKIFISIVLLAMAAGQTCYACEICGCGVGNFYLGLLPHFRNRFIGIRYQYMHFHTHLKTDPSQFSDDRYQTAEVWTGFNLGKKWQVIGLMPYHFSSRLTDDGTKADKGLGDATVIINYNLLTKPSLTRDMKTVEQQLWIGGGFKLPLGKYRIDLNNTAVNMGDVNSQMGTGALDFVVNGSYTLAVNNFGWSTSASYQIHGTNPQHYKFGNRLASNSFVYYVLNAGKIKISPNSGLVYERSAPNCYNNAKVGQTGGYTWLGSEGIELSYKKISMGFNQQFGLKQHISDGQTKYTARGLVHVSLSL